MVNYSHHSKTPWNYTVGERASHLDYITAPKGLFICAIDVSRPENKANAAFILKAANAYDGQIKLLKNLKRAFKRILKILERQKGPISTLVKEIAEQAVAQINF